MSYCKECRKEITLGNSSCIPASCGIDCYLNYHDKLIVDENFFISPSPIAQNGTIWLFNGNIKDFSKYSLGTRPDTYSLRLYDRRDFYTADLYSVPSLLLKELTNTEEKDLLETIRKCKENLDIELLRKYFLAERMK